MDGVFRTYHDFYSQRADLRTGQVADELGNKYDLFVVENTNNVKRRYSGLTTQASYRFSDGLDIGANYTLSRLWGNFDGETSASGPSVAQVDAFPEYKDLSWNAPEGDLAADQRHRARIWATFVTPMPEGAGSLTFGLLQQIGSGVPYGAVGSGTSGVNTIPFVTPAPGYLMPQGPPGAVDYYYTARDAFRTETTYRTDLAISYGYRVGVGRSQPELFFHGESSQYLQPVSTLRLRRGGLQQRRHDRPLHHRAGSATPAKYPDADGVQSVHDRSCERRQLGLQHNARLGVRQRAQPLRVYLAANFPILGRRQILTRPAG